MLEKRLSNIEEMVMACIWDSPCQLHLAQIVSLINERFDRCWRPQTISTYLATLVKKGFLSMYRSGRVYLYQAEVKKETYLNERIQDLMEFWSVLQKQKQT